MKRIALTGWIALAMVGGAWVGLAGPVMNYVTAVLVAWALLVGVGLRVADPSARVGTVVPGRPAEAAGLRSGDRIVAVDGKPVGSWEELVEQVQRHPGAEIVLEVERGDGPAAARQRSEEHTSEL